MSSSSPTSFSRYSYAPSVDAAIIVGALYSAAFAVTFYQWIRYRAWVWFPMVIGAAMEAAGYIIRSLSAQNVTNKSLYVAQFCLIVLAPVLMAAACYIAFGRIFYNVIPPHERTFRLLWVPPRFLTPIFVTCDIIALLIQTLGAIILTAVDPTDPSAASKLNRGKTIALIGLGIQITCFGLFSVIAVRFHFTSKRFEAGFGGRVEGRIGDVGKYWIADGLQGRRLRRDWRPLLWAVNLACVLILVRSVYRVIDFALGKTGYTERFEWCYIFDALPIYPCVAMFCYWHPARYLPYLGFRLPKHVRNPTEEVLEIN